MSTPRAAILAPLLVVAATAGLTILPRPALACSFPENRVLPGRILAAGTAELPRIPRNAAFLWALSEGADPAAPFPLVTDGTTQAPIMGHVVKHIASGSAYSQNSAGLFIAKADELFAPNRLLLGFAHVSTGAWTTGDYVDDQPPTTPVLTSGAVTHHEGETACASNSCGDYDYLNFSIALPVTDDHTPAEVLIYAVYLEKTAEEARTAGTAFVLLAGPSALGTFVDASWVDSDAFIAVSAIDFAGNESPRSEPYQVNARASGCAIEMHRRRPPAFAAALAILGGLAWARRRTRRR